MHSRNNKQTHQLPVVGSNSAKDFGGGRTSIWPKLLLRFIVCNSIPWHEWSKGEIHCGVLPGQSNQSVFIKVYIAEIKLKSTQNAQQRLPFSLSATSSPSTHSDLLLVTTVALFEFSIHCNLLLVCYYSQHYLLLHSPLRVFYVTVVTSYTQV